MSGIGGRGLSSSLDRQRVAELSQELTPKCFTQREDLEASSRTIFTPLYEQAAQTATYGAHESM